VLPPELAELVMRSEGFHRVVRRQPVPAAVPYLCPAGFWTIGYGELCRQDHPEVFEPEARERLLAIILPRYAAEAYRLSPGLPGASTRRQTAIIDFIYNLGPARYAASTLRRRVNSGDWEGAMTEIRRWVYGGGAKLPGLVLRRELEANLLR